MRGTLKTFFQWLDKHTGFRLYAVLLLLTMAVTYDFQVLRMGAYYDDWEGVFLYKQGFSAAQIWSYFLNDRPLSAWVHLVFNPILGASPLGWHLLGLLLNWGAILFLVQALLQLWPRRTLEVGWIGLLLAVYPGLHRQFVVHTSAPHYVSMLLFTLSLLLMVRMVQSKRFRVPLLLASLVLASVQVLTIEYFAGLELIRALILFGMFRESAKTWKEAVKPTLLAWLPYGLVFAGFVFYRLKLLPAIQVSAKAPSHSLEIFGQLLQNPFGTALHYLQNVLQDVVYSVLYVWSTPWIPQDVDLQSRVVLISWAAGFGLAVLCALLMWSWHQKSEAGDGQGHPGWAVLLGVSALLLGGLPAWIIDAQAVAGTWSDRFLFGQMFGAVPLLVLMLAWMGGSNRRNVTNIVCAILLAGSLALQFRVGNDYVTNWKYQTDFYWQLKWRAPSLRPGTFVLSTSTPFGLNDHYQIAYAINTLFNSGGGKTDVAYWWFNGPEALWDSHGGGYPAGSVTHTFRTITFESDMKYALPVIYDKSGGRCLQVADQVYAHEPLLDRAEQDLFSVAHPGQITSAAKPVPQDVFGQEPAHDWCYFYQRADLARQYKQWNQVLQIWKAAGPSLSELRYGPEYLPVIEAFARKGNWAKAAELTLTAQKLTANMPVFLCGNWARIVQGTPASESKTAGWAKVQAALGCQP